MSRLARLLVVACASSFVLMGQFCDPGDPACVFDPGLDREVGPGCSDAGSGGGGGDPAPGACAPGCAADEVCDAGRCLPARRFDDMVLHAQSGALTQTDGAPLDFRGAISCCGGGYGWPLFDEAWVDYVAAKNVDFLHVRLGPFTTGDGGESDWAGIGGGYVETAGQVDLTRFNPAFWARVRQLLAYAGDHGMWVEVDLIDGWGIKHCRWGDLPGYSAWSAANNLQGQDWCAPAGNRALTGDDVQAQWIRKVVRETGRFGNVAYQDGNEIGLLDDYDPAWTRSLAALVRDEESRDGYARHLFGSNSGDATALRDAAVDYGELHQASAPAPAACYGKPCGSNEYNPNPPLTPAQVESAYCAARRAGTYFWYWRHDQTDDAMEGLLARIADGC